MCGMSHYFQYWTALIVIHIINLTLDIDDCPIISTAFYLFALPFWFWWSQLVKCFHILHGIYSPNFVGFWRHILATRSEMFYCHGLVQCWSVAHFVWFMHTYHLYCLNCVYSSKDYWINHFCGLPFFPLIGIILFAFTFWIFFNVIEVWWLCRG